MNLFENDVESWEHLARTDPLWAVLSSEEFRDAALTPESEARFWRSGSEHVDHVLSIIAHELVPSFAPGVSLDFGCGVGRNLVPLAERSGHAIGLDVSPTMVRRCRARLETVGIANAEATVIDRSFDWPGLERSGPVDFVHSVLVFQHIVAVEGFALFDQLLGLLAPGGCGFVQFHCKSPGGELDRTIRTLRLRHRHLNTLALRSGIRRLSDVVMLYEYDVVELLSHLASHAVADVVMERIDTGEGGYDARLYFAKFAGTEEEFAAAGRGMKVRVRR
ncbi:MAG: class I SAM-dependent methyltransferase [Acidimicrobiales bacterium]